MTTLYDEWAFIGGGWIGGMASVQQPLAEQWVMLSYDVMTRKPAHLISAAALQSIANFNFNYMFQGDPGAISMFSLLMPQGTDGITSPVGLALATLGLSTTEGPQYGPFLDGVSSVALTPRQGLTVSTMIKVTGPADFSSFIHTFEVIPEPASFTMAGAAAALAVRPRRRRLAAAHCSVGACR
jgi:hypothetical protein